jgi:hypothetical protein
MTGSVLRSDEARKAPDAGEGYREIGVLNICVFGQEFERAVVASRDDNLPA